MPARAAGIAPAGIAPAGLTLRLALAALAAIVVAASAGEALVRAAVPALGAAFERIAPEFRLLALTIDGGGSDRTLRAEVGLARIVVVGGRTYWPDPRGIARVATPAGHVLVAPLIAAITIAAWPASRRREFPLRAAIVAMPLLALAAVDVPAVLAANLWSTFPGGEARIPLLHAWSSFVQTGGRAVIAIGIAAAAIRIAARCGASDGKDEGGRPRDGRSMGSRRANRPARITAA